MGQLRDLLPLERDGHDTCAAHGLQIDGFVVRVIAGVPATKRSGPSTSTMRRITRQIHRARRMHRARRIHRAYRRAHLGRRASGRSGDGHDRPSALGDEEGQRRGDGPDDEGSAGGRDQGRPAEVRREAADDDERLPEEVDEEGHDQQQRRR